MEQEIEQIAQEMTDFCCRKHTISQPIPMQIKTSFAQAPHEFLARHLNEIRKYYPMAMSTFVMISLLIGEAEGPWCGSRWLRY